MTAFASLFNILSLIHCSQSSIWRILVFSTNPVSSYVDTSLSYSRYTFPCIYLHTFQVHILLMRHLPLDRCISWLLHELEWTINKPFTRLIGLKHVTTCQTIIHQRWWQGVLLASRSLVKAFKNNILLDALLSLFDGL